MEPESYEVKCPSGLVGMVRPLRVVDIKMLSSRAARKKDVTSRLMSNVWVETKDAGVYPEQIALTGGHVDWNQALLGDRAFMVYESRRLTHGDDFFFEINCGSCKNRVPWKIDLRELEIDGLSDEAKALIKSKGINEALFGVTLPKSGKQIRFKLFRGSDQSIIQNVIRTSEDGEGEGGVAGMLARMAYIEGCDTPTSRQAFVEAMHLADAEFLREQWEYHDIVVQDTVEIECQSCGAILEVFIPTDARFFSARSARPKTEKAKTKRTSVAS